MLRSAQRFPLGSPRSTNFGFVATAGCVDLADLVVVVFVVVVRRAVVVVRRFCPIEGTTPINNSRNAATLVF